jgi:hypothetical protein
LTPTRSVLLFGLLTLVWSPQARGDSADFERDLFSGIPGMADIEKAMFEEVNRVREEEDLPPFAFDDALTFAARQHSDEMKRLYYFAHESPTPGLGDVLDRVYSAGLTDMSVAENLASENSVPPSADPERVGRKLTELLLASEYHRENILDRRFTHSGIGCVASDEGTLFCTQVFSKRVINFNKIRLNEETDEILKIKLTFETDDVVGVWLDEVNTYVFEPENGAVAVDLWLREKDGSRRVVFARRPMGAYGAMKGFFMGTFDPEDPFDFRAGITDVDVISEERSREEASIYVLEVEGEILTDAETLKIADGKGQYGVGLKGKKFKTKYPLLAGSGLHEIYFVAGDETAHGLRIDTDRPLAEAFLQTAPGD